MTSCMEQTKKTEQQSRNKEIGGSNYNKALAWKYLATYDFFNMCSEDYMEKSRP